MTDKHIRKKQIIVDTAFSLWSRDFYTRMHLNDVMKELGMTKPAFYRYFTNKNELVNEMIAQVLAMSRENYDQLADLTSGPESIMEKLTRTLLYYSDFMRRNLSRVHFMGYLYRKRKDIATTINEINDKAYNEAAKNLDIPITAVHYMNAVFLLISFFSSKKGNTDNVLNIFIDGFKGPAYGEDFSMDRIVEEAFNNDFSLMFQDKMLMAVYEALMEEGDLVVSLGKIADKAGMRKSSLYNYFSNKDEMLMKALMKNRETFLDIQKEFLSRYNRFEEKLFAHMAFLYCFFIKHPEAINIMDKLISLDQFAASKANHPHTDIFFSETVEKAINEGYLNSYDIEAAALLRFMNMTLIMELRYLKYINITREEKRDYLIRMHDLFINGLSSLKEVI